MSDIVERLSANVNWLMRDGFETSAKNVQCALTEIESLRRQLNKITEELHAHQIGHDHIITEKDAEIERLKEDDNTPTKYYQPNGKGRVYAVYGASSIDFADSLLEQLAASQAREVQLREALEWEREFQKDQGRDVSVFGGSVLALPSDTSALEALIAKASEVMRERCLFEADIAYHSRHCCNEIRALPGVTLDDIK